MNDLESLYRQVIMDHYKNPRHKGLKGYAHVHMKNPSCGDDITMEALIENQIIKDINHQGSGCSICCSSASVLSELMIDKTVEEAKILITKYYAMIKGEKADNQDDLEEALVYQGVAKFPARIKCATIAWKALEQILNGDADE
ncbi:MAG: Fe-S cluster assembly sulfur transfer protein SufU [Bacilli bacterium]